MQEEKPKKGKHGGLRPGAGRKPTGVAPSTTVALRLDPVEKEEFMTYIRSRGLTARQFIRLALDALREKEEGGR